MLEAEQRKVLWQLGGNKVLDSWTWKILGLERFPKLSHAILRALVVANVVSRHLGGGRGLDTVAFNCGIDVGFMLGRSRVASVWEDRGQGKRESKGSAVQSKCTQPSWSWDQEQVPVDRNVPD